MSTDESKMVVGDVGVDIGTSEEPAEEGGPQDVSLCSVTFTMAKTAMGVGTLALGGGYALCGVVTGLVLQCVGGLLCMQALYLLLRAARATGEKTFEGLVQRTLGERWRWAFQADLLVMYFVTAIGDLVPSKHFLQKASSHAFQGTDIADWEPNVFLILCVAIVLPVSMLRDMDSLRFTSLLGVACVLAWVGASASYLATADPPENRSCDEISGSDGMPDTGVEYFRGDVAGILQGFAVVSVSYVCHPSILNLFAEARRTEGLRPAYQKCRNGSAIAVLMVTLTYCAVAALGYLTWRDVSPRPSTILACYPSSEPLWVAMYLAMTTLCLCSFPIRAFSPRKTLEVIVGREFTLIERLGYCVVWTGLAAGGAALADNLVKIVTLCGALTVPLMCYLMPAAILLRTKQAMQDDGKPLVESEVEGIESPLMKANAWSLLIAGAIFQLSLLYAAVDIFL